jgi:class 3 adenylate cyclase
MDAPPIQYARTEDGVNIAYWTLGEGPVLLIPPPHPFGHLQIEWSMEPYRVAYERYAEHFTVVHYDPRGCGLSDHECDDRNIDAHLLDLRAVLDATEVEVCAILARMFFGPVAIRYAVEQPNRVEALVLWCAPTHPAAIYDTGDWQSFIGLVGGNWDRAVDAAYRSWGLVGGDLLDQAKEMTQQGLTKRGLLAFHDALQDEPVEELARVRARTLIVHRPAFTMVPTDEARALAASIPGARLVLSAAPSSEWFLDADDETETITGFLLEGAPAAPDPERAGAGLRTLLFTDLESSTALTQALGDAKAQDVLRGHNEAVRAALGAHGGEEVKHTGDGIFAAFGSAVSAVEASLQIQRELAGAEVRVRIGLNAGEPIAEDGDYFGSAVQLAARVCDRAEPGQVLVSNVVKELCSGKLFQFEDQGEATLKGFPEPVRLFVVREE